MDQMLNCDFFFSNMPGAFILMNYNELNGFKGILDFKPLIGNFSWQKRSVRLTVKSYKNYIITGDPFCVSTWLIVLINRLLRKKTFLWTHGWYGDETLVKKVIKSLFFGLSYKVLLYGDYARNLMISEGYKAQKLVCIYNSLDFDTQCEIRKTLKASSIYRDYFHNEFPVLIYIGRIQKSKKLELLIEAVNLLHYKGLNCNLIFIGKEIDGTNLRELVVNYNLNNYIWFYCDCYEESILGELIYNADVCVSPGNVGLTALHSLVYGTPVITHNNFSHQGPEFEVIEKGKTGDLFEENSVDDLTDKISSWISLPLSERENVRQNCYSVISGKYNPHFQIEVLKMLNFQ